MTSIESRRIARRRAGRRLLLPIALMSPVAGVDEAVRADRGSIGDVSGRVCAGAGYGLRVLAPGRPLDEPCELPVAGATLTLHAPSVFRRGRTDAAGRFRLESVPLDRLPELTLMAEAPGHGGLELPLAGVFSSGSLAGPVRVAITLPAAELRYERFDDLREGAPRLERDADLDPWVVGGATLRRFLQERLDALSLVDLDGRRWDRRAFAGKISLVTFWATWCEPCIRELAALNDVDRRHRRRGFQALGVCLDPLSPPRLRRWLSHRGVSGPQVHDPAGLDSPSATRFGIRSLPRSIVIGPDGEVLGVNLHGRAIEPAIEALLDAQGAPEVGGGSR